MKEGAKNEKVFSIIVGPLLGFQFGSLR